MDPFVTLDMDGVMADSRIVDIETHDPAKDAISEFGMAVRALIAKHGVEPFAIVTARPIRKAGPGTFLWFAKYGLPFSALNVHMAPDHLTSEQRDVWKIEKIQELESKLHVDDKYSILAGLEGSPVIGEHYDCKFSGPKRVSELAVKIERLVLRVAGKQTQYSA